MFKVMYSANGMDWEHAVYATKAEAAAGADDAMEMPLVDRAWIAAVEPVGELTRDWRL